MYHNFEKGKKFINKVVALSNLKEFISAFDKNNVWYCLIFGTLLGAIREKDFISYDNDMDIAVFWKDREKILDIINTELPSFELQKLPHLHDINIIKDDEKLEMWAFEEKDEIYIYDPNRCSNVKYEKRFFDNCKLINFNGIKVRVPRDSKEFLTITYGTSWTIPKKNGAYILK